MKNIIVIATLVISSLGGGISSRLSAQTTINERIHATVVQAKEKNLAAGMTSADLERIIGKPDNADWQDSFRFGNDTVRIWICVEKQRRDLKSWRDFVADNKRYGLGYFFVIANNRIATPVPSLTSKDFDVLSTLAKGEPTPSPKSRTGVPPNNGPAPPLPPQAQPPAQPQPSPPTESPSKSYSPTPPAEL